MNHYTGAVPDSEPAGQWVKQGACKDSADVMFPGTVPAEIEDAKAICRGCPVVQECGQWALDNRIADGVWGGMSEADRRNLHRQAARRNLSVETVKAERASRPVKQRTLRSIFDASTTRLHGGHLAWTGPKKVHFGGRVYTPKQVCFTADRGHRPDGQVTSRCRITACVLPRHLIDTGERTRWAASVKASA